MVLQWFKLLGAAQGPDNATMTLDRVETELCKRDGKRRQLKSHNIPSNIPCISNAVDETSCTCPRSTRNFPSVAEHFHAIVTPSTIPRAQHLGLMLGIKQLLVTAVVGQTHVVLPLLQ
jgi:hypothetical protein